MQNRDDQHTTHPSPRGDRRALRRIALSSMLGTTIEYYDFLLYSTMAALVFGKLFFPDVDPLVGSIASFGTLAAGYAARPLGGLLFGHFGDRLGRKSMLIITMTMMGVASALIGLLPTHATIGVLAPVLLTALRIIQGIAVGGEWGGAALMVVEHSDAKRRGRGTGIMQLGTPFGFLLSTATVALFTLLPPEQFLAWGWRIPFLLSAALLVIGLYVRLSVTESPIFEGARKQAPVDRAPVRMLLQKPTRVFLAIAAGIGPFALTALTSTHIISYATGIGYSMSEVLRGLLIMVSLSVITIPLFAAISDKFGRRKVMLSGAVGAVAYAFPLYALVNTKSILILTGALLLAQVLQNAMHAPLTPLLSEMFPTTFRYTGVSVGYQVAALIGAGFTPLIASSLVASTNGSSVPLSILMAAAAATTGIALLLSNETNGRDLTNPEADAFRTQVAAEAQAPDIVRS